MPKKSTGSRNGTQRQKAKTPKSFALVHPVSDSDGLATSIENSDADTTSTMTSTATLAPVASTTAATAVQPALATTSPAVTEEEVVSSTPKGSASARIAARRQAAQRLQQRGPSTLITSEHFAYVRKDLTIIATLAVVMLIIILATYFTLGHGI